MVRLLHSNLPNPNEFLVSSAIPTTKSTPRSSDVYANAEPYTARNKTVKVCLLKVNELERNPRAFSPSTAVGVIPQNNENIPANLIEFAGVWGAHGALECFAETQFHNYKRVYSC